MNSQPFFTIYVLPQLNQIIHGTKYNEKEKSYAFMVSAMLEGKTHITGATTKPLNRYAVQPGKIFGQSSRSPEKYKVMRLLADDVVVMDLSTQRTQVRNINALLADWSQKGIREISFLEDLIGTVKSMLGPFLGVFLTGALISWLVKQVKET